MRNVFCNEERECKLEAMGPTSSQSGGGGGGGGAVGLIPESEDYVVPFRSAAGTSPTKRRGRKPGKLNQSGRGGKGKSSSRRTTSAGQVGGGRRKRRNVQKGKGRVRRRVSRSVATPRFRRTGQVGGARKRVRKAKPWKLQ
jgi:hypothetical protein